MSKRKRDVDKKSGIGIGLPTERLKDFEVCAEEKGATLGERLKARATKRRRIDTKRTFREQVWPELLRIFEKAANSGQDRVRVLWEELGLEPDVDYITDYVFYKLIEDKLQGQSIEIDGQDYDPIEFVFDPRSKKDSESDGDDTE